MAKAHSRAQPRLEADDDGGGKRRDILFLARFGSPGSVWSSLIMMLVNTHTQTAGVMGCVHIGRAQPWFVTTGSSDLSVQKTLPNFA